MAKLAPVLLLMLLTPTASLMAQESAGYETHRFDDGSVLLHYPDAGVLARGDANGKVVAQAKVPRRGVISPDLEVLLPPDQKRVLLILTGDDATAPAPHRLIVLNATTLRTDSTLQIGPCVDADGSSRRTSGSEIALLCQHAQNPAVKSRKPELALVTFDTASGRLVRWLPLGGTRHGAWFGPMFFGYSYNAYPKPAAVSNVPCPALTPDVRLPDSAYPTTVNVHPWPRAFVVQRYGERGRPTTWEAWFDASTSDQPRRTAAVAGWVENVVLCEADAPRPEDRRLLLYARLWRDARAEGDPRVFQAEGRRVFVVDVATAQILEPASP